MLCKHKELMLIPSIHVQSQPWGSVCTQVLAMGCGMDRGGAWSPLAGLPR